MNKKLIWGIVIVIILIGVGIWYKTNYNLKFIAPVTEQNKLIKTDNNLVASDETSNWKTYTSQKFRFSLKYPVQLVPKEIATTTSNELLRISFSTNNEESFLVRLIKLREGEALHPYVGTGKFTVICGVSDYDSCEIIPGPQGNYLVANLRDQSSQDLLEKVLETYKETSLGE